MVKTRGVKNPLPPCLLEDLAKMEIKEDKELWEEEQEALLLKLKATKFADIPPEILPHIVEYLDDLRDIYNVSMTSKALRASVQDITIVRACAFNGGERKEKKRSALICSALMEQLQQGSIRPPSTFRLLRLVTACRCELGEQCLGYSMTTKTSALLPSENKRAFGLALCKMCLSQNTTLLPRRFRTNDPILDPRIARHNGNAFLFALLPEQVTGEKVGPYVLSTRVHQIHNSYQAHNERLAAVEELLTTIGKEIPEGDTARSRMLVDMYTLVKADFLASEERKEILKSDGKAEKAAKKRERVAALLADVGRQLGGDYEYKDIALDGNWNETTGEYHFSYSISHKTIGRLLSAPTACKGNVLEQKIDEMKTAYLLLFSHGIATNDPNADIFPSLRSSKDAVDLAAYRYVNDPQIRPKWTQRNEVLDISGHQVRVLGYDVLGFLRQLREQGPVSALVRPDGGYVCYRTSARMKGIFVAHATACRDPKITSAQRTTSLGKALAETLWNRRHNDRRNFPQRAPLTAREFRQSFHACFKDYDVLSQNLSAYLRHKATKDFLKETSVPASHQQRWQHITRLDTLEQLYRLEHQSEDLIRNKNYEELLVLHKVLFLNPSMQKTYYY